MCADCVDDTELLLAPTSPEPELRFADLFKAAQVLLGEGIEDENQIYATLAFANEVGRGTLVWDETESKVGNGIAWGVWADSFAKTYKNLRAVRIVGGVLIVERTPVFVEVVMEKSEPASAEIAVYRHTRPPDPVQVAEAYRQSLIGYEVEWGGGRGGISWSAGSGRLIIKVGTPNHLCRFPSPELIREVYRALCGSSEGDGYVRILKDRLRGGPARGRALVLACVAYYLRHQGKISGRKEVHRLINEHLLYDRPEEERLPDGYSSSPSTQLWEAEKKVERPLLRMMDVLLFHD